MEKGKADLKDNKIIAVDFDGTIVDHDFPRIGKLKEGAKRVLNKWHDEGIKVIVWTCRNNVDLPEWGKDATIRGVQDFLDENGIKYDTINEMSTSQAFRLNSRKVYADLYIDDRNLGGFRGWDITDIMVSEFYRLGSWDFVALNIELGT